MGVRRAALWLLITSIVVSGAAAILALVTGEFGRLQAQVLLSALATSGASICGMACGAAWDQDRWRRAALGGLGIVAATLIITKVAVWFEPDPIETWMKVVATGWLFSVATAHASLLGLARTDEMLRWVRASSVALGVILASGIALPVWSSALQDSTGYFRVLGVVGVLMLTGSLSLPVAARLRGLSDDSERDPGEAATQVMCPSCGRVQSTPLGLVECDSCGASFHIELT